MDVNSENCWKPLRAEAPQRSEQSQSRRDEKSEDWAISSRADEKSPEGSTTRTSNLKTLYAEMTARQIAELYGVSPRTATRMLHAAGVELRKPGEKPTTDKLRNREWLKDEYERKSAERIAKDLCSTPGTVIRAIRKHGIPVRTTNKGWKFDPMIGLLHSEKLKGGYTGDKNPNWRGGTVKDYLRQRTTYAAKEWSRLVRERDKVCVKCGSSERLHAHHLIPWKKDPSKRFDLFNGITLCVHCHQREHKHRFPNWVYG